MSNKVLWKNKKIKSFSIFYINDIIDINNKTAFEIIK